MLNVVLSLPTSDVGYHSLQSAAAEAAARRLGVNLQLVYANVDAITQGQQLLTLIQSRQEHPHAIILEPVGTPLPLVAKAAASAGIGWVVLNRDAEYLPELRTLSKSPAFQVSTDHKEVGRIQGRQFGALLPEGGLVLYIEGPANSDATRARTEGMQSSKPSNIEIKTVRGNWTETGAYHAIASWLRLSTSRQLPVKAIGCQSDPMAIGARKAFQELGGTEQEKWLKLPFTGCDGLPDAGQAWVRSNQLAATVVIPPNAGSALEMFVQAHRTGTQPPERTLTAPYSFPAIEQLHGQARSSAHF